MQKCGYYPGIRFLQLCTRKIPGILPISPISPQKCSRFGFREAGGIPYHFLISAGLGFDEPKTPIPVKFEHCVSACVSTPELKKAASGPAHGACPSSRTDDRPGTWQRSSPGSVRQSQCGHVP